MCFEKTQQIKLYFIVYYYIKPLILNQTLVSMRSIQRYRKKNRIGHSLQSHLKNVDEKPTYLLFNLPKMST